MGDRMRLPDGMGAPMGAVAEGPEQPFPFFLTTNH